MQQQEQEDTQELLIDECDCELEELEEVNAIGAGNVGATSHGGAWGDNSEMHKTMWSGDKPLPVKEKIELDIEEGDILLGGKFKNRRVVVKSIEVDELGQYTINGKPLLKFRIEKDMPQDKKSKQTQEEEENLKEQYRSAQSPPQVDHTKRNALIHDARLGLVFNTLKHYDMLMTKKGRASQTFEVQDLRRTAINPTFGSKKYSIVPISREETYSKKMIILRNTLERLDQLGFIKYDFKMVCGDPNKPDDVLFDNWSEFNKAFNSKIKRVWYNDRCAMKINKNGGEEGIIETITLNSLFLDTEPVSNEEMEGKKISIREQNYREPSKPQLSPTEEKLRSDKDLAQAFNTLKYYFTENNTNKVDYRELTNKSDINGVGSGANGFTVFYLKRSPYLSLKEHVPFRDALVKLHNMGLIIYNFKVVCGPRQSDIMFNDWESFRDMFKSKTKEWWFFERCAMKYNRDGRDKSKNSIYDFMKEEIVVLPAFHKIDYITREKLMEQKTLEETIKEMVEEEFKSQAQRGYFYAMANKGGKEGAKFKKLAQEFEDDTPKGKKLPKKLSEEQMANQNQSIARELVTMLATLDSKHMTMAKRDIALVFAQLAEDDMEIDDRLASQFMFFEDEFDKALALAVNHLDPSTLKTWIETAKNQIRNYF